MFWVHRYLHEVPALGFDPLIPEFVETVFYTNHGECVV
jgi:hypothetical protein